MPAALFDWMVSVFRYQMYLDNLPAWALVGDFGDGHNDDVQHKNTDDAFIYTHRRIEIAYNGDQIVEFNVTAGKRAKLEEGATIHFTYEVLFLLCLIGQLVSYPCMRACGCLC